MNWRTCVLVTLLGFFSPYPYAQGTLDDTLRKMEEQRRQSEREADRARIRTLEFEADMARSRAQTDRIQAESDRMAADMARSRAQTERIRAESDRMAADLDAQAAAAKSRREADWREEAARSSAKKAKEAADELLAEMNLASVKMRNNLYLLGLVALLGGFGVFVIQFKRRGVLMGRNEKFGVVAIIVSFLLALFFLMISTNWAHNLDFLANLMLSLKIQIQDDGYSILSEKFLIDFPTKYLILGCLVAAAYGVTTYLGITPVPWKEKEKGQRAPSEPTNQNP